MREIIYTKNAPEPVGVYSQAVVTEDLIFTAGQIAIDPETGAVLNSDIKGQTRLVLKNIKAILEAAGSSMEKAVKLTVFMTDLSEFGAVNEVFGEFFKESPPARAVAGASSLPKGLKIEIDCIALK